MEFKYEGLDSEGKPVGGVANAASQDAAIVSLQRKGITITGITVNGQASGVLG